ncbi:hypothetical protein [Helicobacter anatolicus]|uniref:hypothetical protein n=1 Tax=Helicobacter anatolicus TaxID=2905874 RepID=UPI001E414F15|nr:hypothetical protein [Helicobacter anatolicus]MCE3038737.1 hypothetical protein [Helicobacter anatolicus]
MARALRYDHNKAINGNQKIDGVSEYEELRRILFNDEIKGLQSKPQSKKNVSFIKALAIKIADYLIIYPIGTCYAIGFFIFCALSFALAFPLVLVLLPLLLLWQFSSPVLMPILLPIWEFLKGAGKIVGGLILALITIPLICLYIIAAPLYAIICLFGIIGLFFSILS